MNQVLFLSLDGLNHWPHHTLNAPIRSIPANSCAVKVELIIDFQSIQRCRPPHKRSFDFFFFKMLKRRSAPVETEQTTGSGADSKPNTLAAANRLGAEPTVLTVDCSRTCPFPLVRGRSSAESAPQRTPAPPLTSVPHRGPASVHLVRRSFADRHNVLQTLG